jgi:hypothetical protein
MLFEKRLSPRSLASSITNGDTHDSRGGGIYNDHSIFAVSSCIVTGSSADFCSAISTRRPFSPEL